MVTSAKIYFVLALAANENKKFALVLVTGTKAKSALALVTSA